MAWRVARSLDVLLDQFNRRYPTRSKASDGSIGDASHQSRDSDHNPWYGPGIVTARDFTHDPAAGMDIDRITNELAASRDPRIKYIIANGMILDSRPGNRPWQWVHYTGASPHDKHFHLSVMASPLCDDPTPWNLPCFRTELPDLPSPAETWNHLLPDPYPNAGPKPAAVLLGWAATHAALAREQIVQARADAVATRAGVVELARRFAGSDFDAQALTAGMQQAVRDGMAATVPADSRLPGYRGQHG